MDIIAYSIHFLLKKKQLLLDTYQLDVFIINLKQIFKSGMSWKDAERK